MPIVDFFEPNGDPITARWELNDVYIAKHPVFDASPDGGCGSCGSCGSGQCVSGEEATHETGSIRSRFGLGSLDSERSAGQLFIHQQLPDIDLYTPKLLELVIDPSIDTAGTNIIKSGGVLRQVWTGNRLIDIMTNAEDAGIAADSFELRYYRAAQVGSQSGGLWTINAMEDPYRTIVVSKPSGTSGGENLRITELDDGGTATKVVEYFWDGTDDFWTLAEGLDTTTPTLASAVRRESFEEDVDGDTRTETRKVHSGDGTTTLSHIEETYTQYPFGWVLTKRVVDPTTAKLTWIWDYHTTIGEDGYGRLRSFTSNTGYWEHYVYDSDGVLTQKIMQLDDNEYDGSNVTTLAASNRVMVYSQAAGTLPGTAEDVFVKIVTMKVNDDVVGSSYEVYRGVTAVTDTHEVWSIRCATKDPELGNGTLNFIKHMVAGTDNGGDLYASAGHIVSRSWRYDAGHADEYKTARALSPDGQVTLYDYSGTDVVVMERGFADNALAATPVMEYGTRTTTTTDDMGNFVSSHVERVTQDENSGNYFTVSFTEAGMTDEFGRPETMEYYFGAAAETRSNGGAATESYVTSRTYDGCCGTSVGYYSSTTRNGITTQSHYDDLGRVYKTVRADGTTNAEIHGFRVFDGLGRAVDSGIDGDEDGDLERADPDDMVMTVTYDAAGRMTSSEDPEGRKTYRTYQRVFPDGNTYDIGSDTGVFYWETRSYGHDNTAPVSVTWTDSHGDTVLQALCSTGASWPPAADAALTVHRQSVFIDEWVDLGGGDYEHQTFAYRYHNLADVGGDWMDELGDEGDDYLVVSHSQMDVLGRTYRQTDVMGNITEPIFESGTGRTIGTKMGIDTGAMHVVGRMFYREFEGGDDADDPTGDWRPYATRTYGVRPGLDEAPVEDATMSDYAYVETTEDYTLSGGAMATYTRWSRPSASGAPWTAQTTDEQGRSVSQTTYHNGSTSYALAQSTTTYYADDHATTYLRGQVAHTDVMEASGSGTILTNGLRTEYFYDDAGRQVKTASSGRGFTKVEFDDYGRVLRQVFASSEGTNTDVFGADTFTDDIILSETVNTYNLAGEVIQTTSYARAHNAPGTTKGLLSAAAADQSRVSYAVVWRDDNRRVTHQAFYGTNGGAALTDYDPATGGVQAYTDTPPAPDSSDDVLVTKTEYDAGGVAYLTTANDGTQTRIYTDDAGNRTFVVENYSGGSLTGGNPATPASRAADVNRVTQYTYDYSATTSGGGQLVSVTAIDPDADGSYIDNQTTDYIHSGEINAAKRGYIPVNGRPVAVLYPDAVEGATDRSDVITDLNVGDPGDFVATAYYAAGDVKSVTDQREVTWTTVYTTAGQADYRYLSDTGSWTAPSGSDQRFEYTYGDAGELLTATAFSVSTGGAGNRTSEVTYAYDGFYNPVSEDQDHEPTTANHEGQVQYAFDTTAAGNVFTHAYRLDTITYPNGREVELVYGGHNGIDTAISRANGIDEVIGGLSRLVTRYEYLGTSALVVKDYPGAEVRLDFTDEAGEGSLANDPYDASLDRFGRAIRHQWETYDSSGDAEEDLFHSTTAYDRAGNRLYEQLLHAPSYSQAFGHDDLNRITTADRGPLVLDNGEVDLSSGGAEVQAFWQRTGREWHLDQLGNQTSIDTESDTDHFLTASNAGNEITSRSTGATHNPDENANYFSTSPDDKDIFTRFVNCNSSNLSVSGGVLTVNTGSAASPAIILTGEGTGPLPLATRMRVPDPTASGYVGIVIGYNPEDGSHLALLKNFATGDGDWEIFAAVDADDNGSIDYTDTDEFYYVDEFDRSGTDPTPAWHSMSTRPLYNTLNATALLPNLSAVGGHPYGICGLFVGVADAEFDYARWFTPDRAVPLSASWENRGVNRVVDYDSAGDGKLNFAGTWHRSFLPVLLRSVKATRFEATFSVNRVGVDDDAVMRFVFNYHDRNNYDFIQINHRDFAFAPYAFEIVHGKSYAGLTENRNSSNAAAAATGADKIWYRVVSDGEDVRVYAGTSEANLNSKQSSDLWCMRTTSSTDQFGFGTPGQMGFMAGSYTTYVDDITLKTDPDDDASFTDSATFEEVEIEEDFTLGGTGGDKMVDTLTYDDAGNLTFDGHLRYEFDASNRLVAVYNPGVSAADPGSLIAEYRYDPMGRRIEKKVYSADGQEDEQHLYYHGWSNIETRNGSDYVTAQDIWDSFAGHYIDSNAQVAYNKNPGGDDDKVTGGVQDLVETRTHLLQDHRYSNRIEIDAYSGSIQRRYEYTVFGEQSIFNRNYAPIGRFGFSGSTGYTGQTLDPETGNWYFRARYYDPRMGRFISADPLGYVDGMSRFAGYFGMHAGFDPFGTQAGVPSGTRDAVMQAHDSVVNGDGPIGIYLGLDGPGADLAKHLMEYYVLGRGEVYRYGTYFDLTSTGETRYGRNEYNVQYGQHNFVIVGGYGGMGSRKADARDYEWADWMSSQLELKQAAYHHLSELASKLASDYEDNGGTGAVRALHSDRLAQTVRLTSSDAMLLTLHASSRVEWEGIYEVGCENDCVYVRFDYMTWTWFDRGDLHGGVITSLHDGETSIDDAEFENAGVGSPFDIEISWAVQSSVWVICGDDIENTSGWPTRPNTIHAEIGGTGRNVDAGRVWLE